MAKSFDRTVRRMCRKKISDPSGDILGEVFTVEQAISEALIRRALTGAADAVKLIREILSEDNTDTQKDCTIDIRLVE